MEKLGNSHMKWRLHPVGALRACILSLMFLSFASWANDAQVVLLLGKAEVQDTAQAAWRPATVGQQLKAGNVIRTQAASQVALLLRDQTQVRVNENSVLQIKSVSEPGEGSTLELLRGRVWAQVKQSLEGSLRSLTKLVGNNRQQAVRMNTPTATVGIRGTDWELVVGDDGKTTVTVLSGEVEMANAQGRVSVGPNEQAVAESGKAPVKSILTNAKDRVQWVTAYRADPKRWTAGVPAQTAAPLAAADEQLAQGQANAAITLLDPLARGGQGDPMAVALLARALVIAGRTTDAGSLLAAAAGPHASHVEVTLARADLARLEGEADKALALFQQVTTAQPDNHHAWFGIGRVQAERENLRSASAALDEAIRLAPAAPGYLSERATLQALAGDTRAARAGFQEALAKQPDDYLAWTGLGIAQLKSGETEEALTSFLKAGVIEPRFARAQLYVGVAYYQLGNRLRALESVQKAAELDAKDPLPHVMLGMMQGDALELRAAIDSAREAQARMPFLKSLNQVLNDQKGSANVGSALAAQGMDEWAHASAMGSYNPYWAGSALFLADRYTDGFNKNTELYRGFLLDPTVFGASNRFSSLVASPGHYGSLGLRLQRGDFSQDSLLLAANGLSTATVPLAYSLVAEGADGHANPNIFQARGNTFTVGLGMKPVADTGVFYFGTQTDVDGRYSAPAAGTAPALTNDALKQKVGRNDLGLSHRLTPTSQIMAKVGETSQSTALNGSLFQASQATALNTAFAGVPALLPFSPAAQLNDYSTQIKESDAQLSHRFDVGPDWHLGWGLESGRESRNLNLVRSFNSALAPAFSAVLGSTATRELTSTDAYVSARGRLTPQVNVQLDLVHQRHSADTRMVEKLDLTGIGTLLTTPTNEHEENIEVNHRLGLAFAPATGHQLRLVHQNWRRPVGPASLGLSDTLGVPLEDRLVDTGGLVRRTRLQYDWQASPELFLKGFADQSQITNLQSASNALFRMFEISELDAIRVRKPVFGEAFDELEKTPRFGRGEVSKIGFAGNWLVRPGVAVAARYVNAASNNTGAGFVGKRVPYIPQHLVNVSGFWQVNGGWLLGLSGTFRSDRFTDEANTSLLGAGWAFGLTSYWETDDKRWVVEVALTNLHPVDNTTVDRDAKLVVNANYRF